mmetsp:Transcript_823/g.2413  ORF Transcript_823/g.2413 Transcript_823/m.2413 type:complete len:240 (+) Transcript_823:360-1079(+)
MAPSYASVLDLKFEIQFSTSSTFAAISFAFTSLAFLSSSSFALASSASRSFLSCSSAIEGTNDVAACATDAPPLAMALSKSLDNLVKSFPKLLSTFSDCPSGSTSLPSLACIAALTASAPRDTAAPRTAIGFTSFACFSDSVSPASLPSTTCFVGTARGGGREGATAFAVNSSSCSFVFCALAEPSKTTDGSVYPKDVPSLPFPLLISQANPSRTSARPTPGKKNGLSGKFPILPAASW